MFQFLHLSSALVWVPVGITSSVVEIKICVITTEIKNYKSIKKNRRKTMLK